MLHFWLKVWELSIRKKRKHAKHDVFRPKSLQVWELPILNVKRVLFSQNIVFYRRNVSFAFFSGALDQKSIFSRELMVSFAQMYGSFDLKKSWKNDPVENHGALHFKKNNLVSLHGIQTICVIFPMILIHLRRRLHGFVVLNSRLHDF